MIAQALRLRHLSLVAMLVCGSNAMIFAQSPPEQYGPPLCDMQKDTDCRHYAEHTEKDKIEDEQRFDISAFDHHRLSPIRFDIYGQRAMISIDLKTLSVDLHGATLDEGARAFWDAVIRATPRIKDALCNQSKSVDP